MFELMQSGGWMMIPIMLSSTIALAICFERAWALKKQRVFPDHLLAQIWGWIRNNQLDGARLKQIKQSSPLGKILAAGLASSKQGKEAMKQSIQESGNHVVHELEKYLNALGTIASVTPLMGLLGTVVGMIKVFAAIMSEGTGNAQVLAGGISEALITTATGLCVAIPALIMLRFFQRRIQEYVVLFEQESNKLIEALHSERRVEVKQ